VRWLRRSRLDLVSLDEMHHRLTRGHLRRRFVCITIDDGYRDTLHWAYPILKRHQVPFTVYIPTSFPDRLGELWWLALEAVVACNKRVRLLIDAKAQGFECASVVSNGAASLISPLPQAGPPCAVGNGRHDRGRRP
jgi:peptidoglycan/xylan/chitin deacetylase (PgdA/CDA1 family)